MEKVSSINKVFPKENKFSFFLLKLELSAQLKSEIFELKAQKTLRKETTSELVEVTEA